MSLTRPNHSGDHVRTPLAAQVVLMSGSTLARETSNSAQVAELGNPGMAIGDKGR